MTDTKNTVSDELLPCPFCGCDLVKSDFHSNRLVERRAHPPETECILSAVVISMEDREDDIERRAAWNRRASIPGGVGVKGLEWSGNLGRGGGYIYEIAEPSMTPGWRVWVRPNMGMQQVIGGGIITAKAKDRGEAISVAEADYCFRILSALDLSPAEGEVWQFDRYINGVLMAEGVSVKQAATLEQALCKAAAMASKGKNGQVPVLALRPKSYAAPSNPVISDEPTHRHKKRGTEYVLIGIGRMQAENWIDLDNDSEHKVDMREVAVYRSVTDPAEIWVRPREEFEDGRFEALTAALSVKLQSDGDKP